MLTFASFRSTRVRLLAMSGLAGVTLGLVRGGMPGSDIEGLAAALGNAAHGSVAPADVRWEPSGGTVHDLVVGRWVLFLAGDGPAAPRDVWRARVHLAPEGTPLRVGDACDLTQTPLGDDHALVVRGSRAAFATLAYGQEQSVTLLDLEGDPADAAANLEAPLAERVTRWLTNVQEKGAREGIGRVDVTLDEPARAVGLTLGEDALEVELQDEGGRRRASLDYARGELTQTVGAHAEATRHLPKPFVIWAVDTVRAVPWIGPAPIAWLEERVFAARDAVKQLAFKMHGVDATDTLADGAGTVAITAAPAPLPRARDLDGSQASQDVTGWPPASIPSIWKTAQPGEGEWKEPRISWMKRGPEGAPPAFLRTFVRPDEERPYTEVILVAMDMRQLDLDMEAGTEDPKPLTGGHGPGRIPRDPAVITRVTAAFNGAFKTEHGNYGMMVHKRVLLPPQPSAASIVVLTDARVGFGTWGSTSAVGGLEGIADGDIASFRQNLDPLLDQGKLNPMGRALWGYTLPGSGMQTQRSGLCVTAGGQVVYAWGDDVGATALARAMKMAGCEYGMHLDMNPHHTGFIFAAIDEIKGHRYHSELLSPLMEVSPDRYIEYAPKDFFYVTQRDGAPLPLAGMAWRPDPGVQPAPAWMPGVWSARVDGGGDAGQRAEGAIELLDIEAGRASFRIRAGEKEPDPRTGATPVYELSEADAHRVVLSIGVGVSPEKRPRGLATDGRMVLPLRALKDATPGEAAPASAGVLVAQADGALAIQRAGELASVAPHVDFVEVPLLLDDGVPVAGGPKGGAPGDRAALGTTREGRVIVARGDATTDAALTEALRRAGCTRAVALERGLHAPSFVHRAGTATPPRAHYDVTTLYAIAAPMKPRAFRFEALPALAQAAVK